jgi:hypothetical protein
VAFPKPVLGQVIRYCYLWNAERQRGQEEGSKDRPCAVVLVVKDEGGKDVVTVLPITHTPPSLSDALLAIEIPTATKRRLGLDDQRSWIILSEANRFTWPGPDLRMGKGGDSASIVYGLLPQHLFEQIRRSLVTALMTNKAELVRRTQ